MTDSDWKHLRLAEEQARIGYETGGIPIGSVLAIDDRVLGAGHNRRVQMQSATRHAEIDALERTGRLTADQYRHSTLYTTLSPCDMCTGAILLYRIPRVVIGDDVTFVGGEELLKSRGVELVKLDGAEGRKLLTEFISEHPSVWNEDIGV